MSYITENKRVKFGSFEEKMKPILTKLEEPDVFNVYLNADGNVWYDGNRGKDIFMTMHPQDALIMLNILATLCDTSIIEERPYLEVEIPHYGHRLSATIPPVSRAPTFSIRKNSSKLIPFTEMVEQGTMPEQFLNIIDDCIKQRLNILVVGGPGAGKTTIGNALLDRIAVLDPDTRIHVIEKARELIIHNKDYESWAIPSSLMSGEAHSATMEKLQELALRRDPGRMILGECRGKEAAGLLLAWNNGQPGGFTTIHASSALLGLTKLEQYIGKKRL